MLFSSYLKYSVFIFLTVLVLWLAFLGIPQAFFIIKEYWPITLTMMFGSIIAGATSEGGGAIAFPVFTKILHIPPHEAKIFSLAIQSIGMTVASLLIILMRVKVEWFVILWASIAGSIGMLFGSFSIVDTIPSDITKIIFTIITSSLAIVLLAINQTDRKINEKICFHRNKERGILLIVGFLGGIISSLIGSGIDIITFSVLVTLFRIDEKIATTTSIILMAINSICGLFVFGLIKDEISDDIFYYWMSAIPIVVIGAPIGSIICRFLSRKVVVNTLIILIFIELISSLIIIPLRDELIWLSISTLVFFVFIYSIMLKVKFYEISVCKT